MKTVFFQPFKRTLLVNKDIQVIPVIELSCPVENTREVFNYKLTIDGKNSKLTT